MPRMAAGEATCDEYDIITATVGERGGADMDKAGLVGVIGEGKERGDRRGQKDADVGSLDSIIDPFVKDADGKDIAYFPSRVLSALDHVTRDARRDVKRAARAFAQHQVEGTPLPTIDPLSGEETAADPGDTLYAIPATPQLFLLVRRGRAPGETPVVVEDIVTRTLWDHLAHAG